MNRTQPTTNSHEIGTPDWYLASFRLAYQAHQSDWHMYLLSVGWGSDASTLAFWYQSAAFWRREARDWANWYHFALQRARQWETVR